jgi:hypothetical protein
MMNDTSDELFKEVPVSHGIHKRTYFILLVGIIGVFAIGTTVVRFATYGHVWPSTTSQRIDLSAPSSR